jgi:hypothetical protein
MFNKANQESIKGKAFKTKVDAMMTPETMLKLATYMKEHDCKSGPAAVALGITLPW